MLRRLSFASLLGWLSAVDSGSPANFRVAGGTHQPRAADSVGFHCTTDTDCELLGKCVAGRCRCDPGFTGPSCAQLNLAPHAPTLPAWPPLEGYALGDHRRAAGWGFTVAPDANTATLHAVANVGCYSPANMVIGTLLMHLTSTGPAAPWKAVGIVAPPTSFNPVCELCNLQSFMQPAAAATWFLQPRSPLNLLPLLSVPASAAVAQGRVCAVLAPRWLRNPPPAGDELDGGSMWGRQRQRMGSNGQGRAMCVQSPLSFSVPSNPDIRRLYLYCVRGQISLQINSKTLWATL
jgi:hypothetical protein